MVYVIGGHDENRIPKWRENFCSLLNIWKKSFVTGGFNSIVSVSNIGRSNTVEVYDHVAITWSNIPKTIEKKFCHKPVAIKTKLFVHAGAVKQNCEVYDSNCKIFVLLKILKYTGKIYSLLPMTLF